MGFEVNRGRTGDETKLSPNKFFVTPRGIPSESVVHDDLALAGPLNHGAGKRECSINYETVHVLPP